MKSEILEPMLQGVDFKLDFHRAIASGDRLPGAISYFSVMMGRAEGVSGLSAH
jgi:hypothetical protein